ncbi:MAG: hypothetical protein KBD65_00505 [Candidatus Moranbacteria bacterium]|nr:hypothetical protein [Candidatus Moranbacteria bacterium]
MSTRENIWFAGVRTQKKILWGGFFVTLLVVGLYFLWHFMNEKATGVVYETEKDISSSDKEQEIRLYKGKYVHFSSAGTYEEKTHEIPEKGPIRESILLATSGSDWKRIAVTVTFRGTDDLSSDPSFQMRANASGEYEKSSFSQPQAPFSGVFFEKNTQPFERTAFLPLNGYIVSISVTSLLRSKELETELSEIISSLQFEPGQ